MPLLRRFLLLACVALGAAVLAGPALAAFPRPVFPYAIVSDHFIVHYQSDPVTTDAITATQAGDLAGWAERAYTAELADGYPTPPSDGALGGDSRIDIYV